MRAVVCCGWAGASPSGAEGTAQLYEVNQGQLSALGKPVDAGVNPMWAVSSTQGFIYIVDSANPCRTQHGGGEQQGRVNVFKPTASGSLQKLGFAEIGGRGPCHTCLHSSEAYIVVCCYESGSVTVLPISSSKGVEGLLLAPITVALPSAELSHPRQDSSHPHCAIELAGYIAIADLGTNSVLLLKASPDELSIVSSCVVHENAGPRHLVCHPTLSGVVYCVNELDNTVSLLHLDGDTLVETDFLSCIPPNYDGPKPFDFYGAPSHAAAIQYGCGKVFVTNRGHDSIAIFSTDPVTGALNPSPHFESSPGRLPWCMEVVPDSGCCLLQNQFSSVEGVPQHPGSVCVLPMDQEGSIDLNGASGNAVDLELPMFIGLVPTV